MTPLKLYDETTDLAALIDRLSAENEQLRALVARQEDELKQVRESREAWIDRAKTLCDRITDIHVALYQKVEGIRQVLDHHAQHITALNMNAELKR